MCSAHTNWGVINLFFQMLLFICIFIHGYTESYLQNVFLCKRKESNYISIWWNNMKNKKTKTRSLGFGNQLLGGSMNNTVKGGLIGKYSQMVLVRNKKKCWESAERDKQIVCQIEKNVTIGSFVVSDYTDASFSCIILMLTEEIWLEYKSIRLPKPIDTAVCRQN